MSRLRSASTTPQLLALTPKAFYDLAVECTAFATTLVQLDPIHVHLESCHRFNRWRPTVLQYERLAQRCRTLRPARPIARWQLLVLGGMTGLVLYLALPRWLSQTYSLLGVNSWLLLLFIFYFVPEHYYGTTVELLEGRLLLVVDTLLELLQNNDPPVSEAVFFRLKEMLEQTHRELREQIDLVHRV